MSNTLIRIMLFHLIGGLLVTPLYLLLKTGISEFLFVYVPLISVIIAAYMEMTEGKPKNE